MINLPDADAIRAALVQPLDEHLHQLLAGRLHDSIACGLGDLTHMLVIQPGDCEADIVEAIGFSPLVSRLDGERFQADWDWIERHDGWWELVYTVGDSGFAYLVFVEIADGVLPDLFRLCAENEEVVR